MKIALLAVGRARHGPIRDLFEDYADRIRKIGPGLGVRGFDLRELAEAKATSRAERIDIEAGAVLQALAGSRPILLDETGSDLSSAELARWIGAERDRASDLAFVIGGPDGVSPALKQAAARTVAFGRATWPHQLVRVMLAEQIYRALTILGRHPYHRD